MNWIILLTILLLRVKIVSAVTVVINNTTVVRDSKEHYDMYEFIWTT